jgi:hypothetical protein
MDAVGKENADTITVGGERQGQEFGMCLVGHGNAE